MSLSTKQYIYSSYSGTDIKVQGFYYFGIKFKSAKMMSKQREDDFSVILSSTHIIMHSAEEVSKCKCVSPIRFKPKCKSNSIEHCLKSMGSQGQGTFQTHFS